ncbi:iron ABC transporter substrate-binding protein [Lachnoclostridium sp. An131]|uniref:ABC transporter substrate-binding protein n=1 Tax=Lachnoclostridium sp. An131 TaxID=1965555 RepID=UPI000B37EFBC|nr:ABC transporter substrate-binding protein [Lachnoclostridium sp. An131]OUQ28888.1 iron ABC transporter substrate-binding protein [Lachnoclostridium sp. An131]
MRKRGMALFLSLLLLLAPACSPAEGGADWERDTDISSELEYEDSMELLYAEKFSVDYYTGGFALITINSSERYLVVPEGESSPEDLEKDITVLYQPLDRIYLVASAVMDMFISMDSLDVIRFTGTKAEGWYLEEARQAVESGDILYAGNYSAPDYEQILAEGCDLAIENTMIYHTPEVKEQLERFGIPVMVDYSSYETEPLGRTEWVKLYGLLAGREEEAAGAFAGQQEAFASIGNAEDTGKTVAFFYITNSGEVNVRKASDYLPKMIELAGGRYVFSDLGAEDDTASSTVSLQMEEFYAAAREADYLIYNSTIDGELSSVEELFGKSELLENFKAVGEGNVYCTTRDLYQSSMELGTMIADIHGMLNGEEDSLTYLYRLD